MKKEKIEHHLNCIKMCESDKAICKCIERIFEEGNQNGWDESNRCPKCNTEFPDIQPVCDLCDSEEITAKTGGESK